MDDSELADGLFVEMVKRAGMFELLADEPRKANELVDELDASRSTVHRATRSFAEKGLLYKSDDEFELTGFGRAVADEIIGFREHVSVANELQSFLNTVDLTDVDVPMEAFADANVVHPKPRQPHFAVEHITDLIEETDSTRILSGVISPVYVEVAHREMLNGTDVEVVFDPEIVEIIASEYAEKAVRAAETGKFDVLVVDDVPFELFVFDDSVGMAAHDESGIARVFVEADAPEAVEWAESVYESYRDRADRIDVSTF